MRQLSEVWFGTEKTTPLYDELTEFIVDSGTYGTIKIIMQVMLLNWVEKIKIFL